MVNVVTNMSVDVLKVHPRNKEFFYDISGEKYEQFKRSIQEDGIITPITVAPDMTIISGHQRYKAVRDLGIKLIPVIIQENLTDEDMKFLSLLECHLDKFKTLSVSKQGKFIDAYTGIVRKIKKKCKDEYKRSKQSCRNEIINRRDDILYIHSNKCDICNMDCAATLDIR